MTKQIQIGIGDSTKTAKCLKDFSSRKHEITKEEEKFIAASVHLPISPQSNFG
jgi:hypothetical protein